MNIQLLYLCLMAAGRPKSKDPKENVPLRLRKSLRDKIQKEADKKERSLSYFLEKAIEEKYA